jgi:SET domain-containing protein
VPPADGHDRPSGKKMTPTRIHLILKPSLIEGVGVFTLTAIKKGIRVPLFDEDDSKTVSRREYAAMPKAYSRYHVPDIDEKWWGPRDYHRMSIGWYLNHSETPNIDVVNDYTALRRIAVGEELTIDYSYSKFDWVKNKDKRHGRPPYKLLD